MPQDFDRCVKGGGRVRRVSGPSKKHGLKAGEYVNFCYDGKGAHRGHVKTSKAKHMGKGK